MSVGADAKLYALVDIRQRAADVLAPAVDTDPAVLVDVVDAVEPPALMLSWGDPWLIVGTPGLPVMGPEMWSARLDVLCIAGRIEPGPGVGVLETLVAYAVARFKADGYSWPFSASTAPRVFDIGGVRYLAARLTYSVPVTI